MFPYMAHKSGTAVWNFTRSGSSGIDIQSTPQRAATFAAAATGEGTTVLLSHHDVDGLHNYFIGPDTGGANQAAMHLANTVNASAKRMELPFNLDDSRYVGHLEFRNGSTAFREVLAGTDPAETARLLAATLPLDSWVAIVIRQPVNSESRNAKKWLAHRLGAALPQHHSIAQNAVIISIWAGTDEKRGTQALLTQVAAILPGFDVAVQPRIISRFGVGPALLGVGVLFAAAVIFGVPFIEENFTFAALTQVTVGVAAAAAVAGLTGILRLFGITPSKYKRLRRRLDSLHFPSPAKRIIPPARPRAARVQGERQIQASEGAYPLASNAFLVGPQVIVGAVAPHAGAASGAASTTVRATPPALKKRIGPLLGHDDAGEDIYLSAAEMLFGVTVLGQPGSGKSNFVRSVYGWYCMDRVAPAGVAGFPGTKNAMIAFESKGDGAEKYERWSAAAGDKAMLFEVADPSSLSINLFGTQGTPGQKANDFVDALVYTFGEGAIQGRSRKTLVEFLTAALVVTPNLASQVSGLRVKGSPIYYTYVLLGGYGDQLGVDLAGVIMSEAVRRESAGATDAELNEARDALLSMYSGQSASVRAKFNEAPISKISQLLAFDHWFSPERKKVAWKTILTNHRSVIINTGNAANGKSITDSQTQLVSSLLMFTLRGAIRTNCSDFLSNNRYVSIFSDELSLLAGSSEEVLVWLKNQGRSFGVRPLLATQTPESLPDGLRKVIMTFNTLISFAQVEQHTAGEVADNLSGIVGEWDRSEILLLPRFTFALRTSIAQQRQSAFTVTVPDFEADIHNTISLQGYGARASTPVVSAKNIIAAAPVAAAVPKEAGLWD